MRCAICPTIGVLVVLLACAGVAPAARWSTADGLAIVLSDATGQVESVTVDGRELALAEGLRGGLSFREFVRDPDEPGTVALVVDAEDEEPTWTSAVMADWAADEAFVERRAGDAAQDRKSVV